MMWEAFEILKNSAKNLWFVLYIRAPPTRSVLARRFSLSTRFAFGQSLFSSSLLALSTRKRMPLRPFTDDKAFFPCFVLVFLGIFSGRWRGYPEWLTNDNKRVGYPTRRKVTSYDKHTTRRTSNKHRTRTHRRAYPRRATSSRLLRGGFREWLPYERIRTRAQAKSHRGRMDERARRSARPSRRERSTSSGRVRVSASAYEYTAKALVWERALMRVGVRFPCRALYA